MHACVYIYIYICVCIYARVCIYMILWKITGELQFIEETMNANMYCDILKQSRIPSLWRLGRRAVVVMLEMVAKEAEGEGDGLAKHVSRPKPYWSSVGYPQTEGGGAQGL